MNRDNKESVMNEIEVFDPPMCCSTGVCGAEVDPVLPRFAANLEWLKRQGIGVTRYNMAQKPAAFVEHTIVQKALKERGNDCMPMMRLQDASYTKILIATLPETTPVQEAARLQADLRRTGIEPSTWVINNSSLVTGTKDPVLMQRAASEVARIKEVVSEHAERMSH